MNITTLLQRQSISVSDFRCTAGPGDKPFAEQYASHSISYVRKGSFGCHCRGRLFELVAGSVLVGHPGDEYVCSHDHVCGDECLSFFPSPELVQAIAQNPFVIIVPCHRVLEEGLYADKISPHGGVISKRRLLSIEGAGTTASKTLFEVLLPVAPPRPQG